MGEGYDHRAIEQKWQRRWETDRIYRSRVDWSRPKHYALTMLPYPSGDLHIGHWFAMTPSDARARWMRMRGYNVLFPMGFDAFGLPAENAAIARNVHPKQWTLANIERMRGQLRSMGAMFDWEREAVTCDPSFYRWTEWFFARFLAHGLAYRGKARVNWSPSLQTVLANEQVVNGVDERTGQPVVQRMMEQWFFRTTRYAEELLDFEELDWPDPIVTMQKNWIGRSEGARVVFRTSRGDPIEIFTTRPDTLWGATFMVLAPEHPLVPALTRPEQRESVEAYVEAASRATELERADEAREKTGVFTGSSARNPVNDEEIPIWIADYVMLGYGTGAIMAVPAHDPRDFEFARHYGLEVRPVIEAEGQPLDGARMGEAYPGGGAMVRSGPLSGTPVTEAKGRDNPAIAAVIDWLEERGLGEAAVSYRLRDWLVSRQRYWGAPIPVVRRRDGTDEAVPEAELPVRLPEDVEFRPTGQSPLRFHEGFQAARDQSGAEASRETDTMDTFVCSSWYQYRYLSPEFEDGPFDPEEAAYWLPVDVYTGGAEHANLHLLYTRFFTKAMRDCGVFDATARLMAERGRDPKGAFDEPMRMLRNQGQILGEERRGDFVAVEGRREGEVWIAERLRVVDGLEAAGGAPGGEILSRTENVLRIRGADAETHRVEVPAGTPIENPRVEGPGDVAQLRHHLEIQRMSKSKGNVVSPDELVERYGADTVRAYLMFAFDWEKGGPWDSQGVMGVVRWLGDVWDLLHSATAPGPPDPEAGQRLQRSVAQALARVEQCLERFHFNTAVAALMSLRNELRAAQRQGAVEPRVWRDSLRTLLLMMAPITPHLAEELWERLGEPYSIHQQPWPILDASLLQSETVRLAVQVNGRRRDEIEVAADADEAAIREAALSSPRVQKHLEGRAPRKVIVVPGRLVNLVG